MMYWDSMICNTTQYWNARTLWTLKLVWIIQCCNKVSRHVRKRFILLQHSVAYNYNILLITVEICSIVGTKIIILCSSYLVTRQSKFVTNLYISKSTYTPHKRKGSIGSAPLIPIICARWRWEVKFTSRPFSSRVRYLVPI